MAWASRSPTTTTTAAGRLHHRARRRPPVPQRRARQLPRRDSAKRHSQRELRHQRGLAGLRQGRQGGPLRRQLRRVDQGERSVVLAGRRRPSPTARPNRTKAPPRSSTTISATASFEDVTDKAGLGETTSKSLGIAVLDYNGDGWPDIFVSNDTQPNKLYHNNGNGTFTEEGMQAGVAFGEDGVARGSDGCRFRRLRPFRPPASAGRQLLEPDARPVSQRRQRALCR